MPAPLDPKVAETRMRARGWVPTIPFPGADKPWPGWCFRCKESGRPRYSNVCSPSSTQGPCRPCSGAQKKTEAEARAVMAQRGLTPRTPYQDTSSPWESECGNCRSVTWPTLSSVKKAIREGQPKCCDRCRRNGPMRPEVAEDLLRRAGGEPLVDFPGVKARWSARCLEPQCRRVIRPWFESIKYAGTGACKFCGGYGIKANDGAVVYLMAHTGYSAVKIGIAKDGSRRVALHAGKGWVLHSQVAMLGAQARAVESHVLSAWSALSLPYGMSPENMPYAGFTETVSLESRSLAEAQQDLRRALAAEGPPNRP